MSKVSSLEPQNLVPFVKTYTFYVEYVSSTVFMFLGAKFSLSEQFMHRFYTTFTLLNV